MPCVVHRFYALGSDCAVHLDATEDVAVAEVVEAEVRRIESCYSRYRNDNEMARINQAAAAGGSVEISPETAALIGYAKACFQKSGGKFDISSGLLRKAWDFSLPRLPEQSAIDALLPRIGLGKVSLEGERLSFAGDGMELDFGGLGKEYAADLAAEACARIGVRHGFVDLGGDIRVIGPQHDGQPWRIGIRHPRDSDRLVAEVALGNGALATSGDYERFIEIDGRRYCHIIDPQTGWPAQGLASVTVIADRCLVAGSLSTAAMLKGRDGAAWLSSLGVRHIVVEDTGGCSGTEPLLIKPYS
jgi:thiamine biosynthesis lipoprotein